MVLYIKIPATYKTDTQKIYPCYYCTDGNRSFPLIADMASYFEIPVIVEPEIFVVGIGYKIRDMGDWGSGDQRSDPDQYSFVGYLLGGCFFKICRQAA